MHHCPSPWWKTSFRCVLTFHLLHPLNVRRYPEIIYICPRNSISGNHYTYHILFFHCSFQLLHEAHSCDLLLTCEHAPIPSKTRSWGSRSPWNTRSNFSPQISRIRRTFVGELANRHHQHHFRSELPVHCRQSLLYKSLLVFLCKILHHRKFLDS